MSVGQYVIQRLHDYGDITRMIGGGVSQHLHTEGDFDRSLKSALADEHQMHLLRLHLDQRDASQTLLRMAARMSQHS
jgi:indolepyruvate decarboxylase